MIRVIRDPTAQYNGNTKDQQYVDALMIQRLQHPTKSVKNLSKKLNLNGQIK